MQPFVADTQWSSARIKVLNGNEFIEAGWMVNPSFFNDTEAHFYAKYMDKDDGNWWLSFGDNQVPVGYWPKELFKTLSNFANQADWGGEVDNPGAKDPIPEMGNGYYATYDTKKSAAVIHATIVDDKYNRVTPGEDTHKVWDCEKLYTVKDADYKGEYTGRLLLYGGPKISS
ncbi:Sulfate adenylyltransferase [Bienertia sinuspersici]